MAKLMEKLRINGPEVLFYGSVASAVATFVGHYPWFLTYNFLTAHFPGTTDPSLKLCRSALIGFLSSAVSDLCSNSLRVVKVYRQTSTEKLTYVDAVRNIIKEDGYTGLFGRGLKTKILANGLQGVMFSVFWKMIDENFFGETK